MIINLALFGLFILCLVLYLVEKNKPKKFLILSSITEDDLSRMSYREIHDTYLEIIEQHKKVSAFLIKSDSRLWGNKRGNRTVLIK